MVLTCKSRDGPKSETKDEEEWRRGLASDEIEDPKRWSQLAEETSAQQESPAHARTIQPFLENLDDAVVDSDEEFVVAEKKVG